MVFAQTIGRSFSWCRDQIARGLCFVGIHPNWITAAGCALTLLAGVALACGKSPLAFGLLFFAGAMDILDGAVAKIGDQRTPFGAVLDSSLDRFSDGAIFTGILVFYAKEQMTKYALAASLAMIGAMATSYVRARAESVVEECKVGFWERAERTVLIMIALLFNHLSTAMCMIAFLANWTAIHRIYYTWLKLHAKPGEPEQEAGLPVSKIEGVFYDVIFWKYDRWSWQYDVAVVASIALLLAVKL